MSQLILYCFIGYMILWLFVLAIRIANISSILTYYSWMNKLEITHPVLFYNRYFFVVYCRLLKTC